MSCLKYLLAIFLLHNACVQATLYGVIGASVSANTRTTLTFNSGVAGVLESTLVVTASVDCTVSLSLYVDVNLESRLPNGTAGGSTVFSGNAGFVLAATNNAVLTTPKLTTPAISAALAAAITGTVHAGVLELDTNTNTFTRINVDSYDVNAKTISVTLPGAGTYVIVSINEVVSYPYAAAAACFAGANRTIQFGSDVAIDFHSRTSNTLTVVKSSYTTKPYNLTLGVSLNIFLQISLGVSGQAHDSVIHFTYTQAELIAAGLSATADVASRLRIAYYSDASAQWVVPSGDHSVDTSAQVVSQSTTTFSEWGIYYTGNGAGLLRSNWLMVISAVILPFIVKFF